jgi:hypothetical protein
LSGHPSCQGASCFKDFSASYIELFLQGCKNGLRSTKIIHVVLEGRFENLLENFFSV